jgi:hypothetical protein
LTGLSGRRSLDAQTDHCQEQEIKMNKKSRMTRWAGGILALWLLISSCGLIPNTTSVGETRTETQTVELGSADEVQVRIQMGAGELSVTGGAGNLMDATFRYNVAQWQPGVNYSVNGGLGELVVDHQDEDPSIPVGGALVNEWSLLLSNAVPIDLVIETGAGESELDLHELDLAGLRIEVGAGKTNVDLSGPLDHDLNVAINGGVGEITVKLPGEMGVRVSADTGIGGLANAGLAKDGDVYVNETYGSAPNTLYLDIQAGVGSINLLAP